MLKRLIALFRRNNSLSQTNSTTPESPLRPADEPQAALRDRDEASWDRYENRPVGATYSWTYGETTVTYGDAAWEYHEPNTYRPKPITERFYNELSPDHVNELLSSWAKTAQKGRVREYLEQAAHVSYMRRNHSVEPRSLAELLTSQCIETYPERSSWMVFDWRANLLSEQGRTEDAIQLLQRHLETCQDDSSREGLQKALRRVEKRSRSKAKRGSRTAQ